MCGRGGPVSRSVASWIPARSTICASTRPRRSRIRATRARSSRELEAIGYDGAFSFEAKHDPVPAAGASRPSTRARCGSAPRSRSRFARNPMNLANLALRPAVDQRRALPARARLAGAAAHREPLLVGLVAAGRAHARDRRSPMRAIFDSLGGQGGAALRGRVLSPHADDPRLRPGPEPVRTAADLPRRLRPAHDRGGGRGRRRLHRAPVPDAEVAARSARCPALERGLAKSGRTRAPISTSICATLVVTADGERRVRSASSRAARKQLAFYGSTPAYRPTLDCHGWGDLHVELNRLSKQGRWDDMTDADRRRRARSRSPSSARATRSPRSCAPASPASPTA